MRLLALEDTFIPPSSLDEPDRIVSLQHRRAASTDPYDDLRQLTVVVWARAKLMERRLDEHGPADPLLLAGLADIETAVTAIGVRIDALEAELPRRAA